MTPRAERFNAWKARPGRPTLVALLEASQGRVFAICQEILRHRQDAEEAAQETLLKILVGIEGVRDAEHYESWIKTVAFRAALDRKKLTRRRRLHELNGSTGNRSKDEPFGGLHDALEKLGEEDRALLVERYFDRKTFEEMGRSRGLSDVGVRKRIEKAQDRLKRMLGCGVPVALLAGASVVKAKTLGAIACAVILFIVVGGSFRKAARTGESVTPASATVVAGVVDPPKSIPLMPPASASGIEKDKAVPTPTLDESRKWTLEKLQDFAAKTRGFVEGVAQLREKLGLPVITEEHVLDVAYSRHYQECMDAMQSKGSTPDLTQSARSIETHFAQASRARMELQSHASAGDKGMDWARFDPMTCVEFLQRPEGRLVRWDLPIVFTPAVMREIDSEESPPGPLLERLIPLSEGEVWDRVYFFSIAVRLNRANRAIADVCFRLMHDSVERVREAAISALATHARFGHLKQSISEHIGDLQRLTINDPNHSIRSGAFGALTVVGTPEVDEFLVQQVETNADSGARLSKAETLVNCAPRVLVSHRERFAAVVRHAANQPFPESPQVPALRLSLQLPKETCVDLLRYLASKLPAGELEAIAGVEAVIGKVEQGEKAAVQKEIERLRRKGESGIELIRSLGKPVSAPN